jgi:hypothetical protein
MMGSIQGIMRNGTIPGRSGAGTPDQSSKAAILVEQDVSNAQAISVPDP